MLSCPAVCAALRLVPAALIATALFSPTAGRLHAAALDVPVAMVNGDAIVGREFVEALRRVRALHDDGAQLRAAALEACVRFVVTLQVARAHGVTGVASDAALREEFARENARRATALAEGGVVYGPRRLSWEQFRATWLDRVELDLGRALLAHHPPASRDRGTPHADLRACKAAIDAARARASVRPDAARLAVLHPNSPLPEQE